MSEPLRLQKHLSQQGVCSRREAEIWIREGRILINDEIAQLGDRVGEGDRIIIDGKPLKSQKERETIVLAYFKPKGVESTLSTKEEGRTLGKIDFGVGRVFPIGRLDKDSQGLLLLTNDGDLGNHLAHPKYQKEKEYLVSVRRDRDNEKLKMKNEKLEEISKRLEKGVELEDGKRTRPCRVKVVEPMVSKKDIGVLQFVMTEGRNRQIRRMCEAVDLEVVNLLRIRIGNIKLGEMKEGKWRVMGKEEVKSLS